MISWQVIATYLVQRLDGVDWSGWAQFTTGIAALAFTPAYLQSLFKRFYYRFHITCLPSKHTMTGSANKWVIHIHNRSNKLRELDILIYPSRVGSLILYANIATENDGGLRIRSANLDGGAFSITADRVAPGREIIANVTYSLDDQPKFHSSSHSILDKVEFRNSNGFIYAEFRLIASKMRLMVLMLYFAAATLLIVANLAYLGLPLRR